MLATLGFLTPRAGLVALGVVPVLVAAALATRRGRRARVFLGLPAPRRSGALATALALAAVPALLGLAAAQPVVRSQRPRTVRTDEQAIFVVDISRSMLASARPRGQTRFDRARRAAARLRLAVPELAVGLASLTDRALPLLFPSADEHAFQATLERALTVDAPPPQEVAVRATSLGALTAFATEGYFPPSVRHRLVVVFTDGDSQAFPVAPTARMLARHRVQLLAVRVGSANERVYGAHGIPEAGYRPDPRAADVVDALATAAGGQAFDEQSLDRAAAALRKLALGGPRGPRGREVHGRALAAYAAVAAFAPLALLLWRRNLAP